MSLKHLLVHVDSTPRAAERVELAVTIARRSSARLVGLFAEVDQLGPSLVAKRTPDALRAAQEAAREVFTRRAGGAGVANDWWPIEAAAYGELLELAATCCRYVDLAVLGQRDPANERAPKDLVEQILLQSGRPVLVVPSGGHFADVGRRAVVAWTATREAARAVNDAIPLVRDAELVHVVAFQRERERRHPLPMPPVDVVAHLAAHGIRAKLDLVVDVKEGETVLNAVLNHAFDVQADLTVMGGSGVTFPLPHALGTTKEVLRSMPTPVLLSH